MLKLTLSVLAIALPDCINPSLIGGQLLMATGEQPRRRATTFTLAAWTVTFVFGLAVALGLGDVFLSLVPKPGPTVKYVLIAAAGVVLALSGVWVVCRRRALTRPRKAARRLRRSSSAAMVGAGIAGVELLTAFPYFAAIALIVGSGVSTIEKLVLLILYCVAYTLPLIVIAIAVAVMGDRAERRLIRVDTWLLAHWPLIAGPLTATIGIAVLTLGIIQLS